MAGADVLRDYFGDVPGAPETIDWVEVETELGRGLPDDYKDFCLNYPAIEINGFITILHPRSDVDGGNLIESSTAILEGIRATVQLVPESVPFPVFPDDGGILPWGYDVDGAYLFWKTRGDPDEWTIVVGYDTYCEHKMVVDGFA
ncbi:SMI1/KNR4 family protein [Crossiella sp. CA198]|uniref:SMI1/KNR4 family protein n=1 Tax=Crossiella sp. CA198 TaxID=3455607 RepID=UPI003F8D77C0